MVLLTAAGVLSANASLYPQMPFDPASAFAPVSQVAEIGLVVVTSTASTIDSVPGLVAFARTTPGKLTYASPGAGSTPHLAMESFKQATGIAAEHIPYKSGAEAVQSVVAGQVDVMFADLPLVLSQVRAGRLRVLAVAGGARLPQLPDVSTLEENNLRGVRASSWFGLVAPARTPRPIIDRLNALLERALHEADLEQRFTSAGAKLVASRPDEFSAFIGRHRQANEALIRSANIRLQ